MSKKFTESQIREFWIQHDRFLKNNLVTESPNPKTHNLSQLCQEDLAQAFNIFKQVEIDAIKELKQYTRQIELLQQDISNILKNNGKIFLIGCGASGRLAMLLKRLWEEYNPTATKKIVCVSSAGDVSLIKAVEQFEDKKEFGIKQLLEQGFQPQDLVIGLSASGESPFILAAVEYAAKHSKYQPYLVFNNPVCSLIERNASHIINNPLVKALELNVGPMALTGSTRLQATTAMQIALGIALCKPQANVSDEIDQILQLIESLPLNKLSAITNLEANFLKNQEFILYQTNDKLLGLSLLADTTERSPTFNLPAYENNIEPITEYSPFYLSLTTVKSSLDAWQFLLDATPTCLNWVDFTQTSNKYILGFDLSNESSRKIGQYLPRQQHISSWILNNNNLTINLESEELTLSLPEDNLDRTLIYKVCLNAHSTLMMGYLEYFWGNMMLSLKPSNFKLIDRAIRYSQFILKHEHNMDINYKELAEIVFYEIENLKPNQSIVKNVVDNMINAATKKINE